MKFYFLIFFERAPRWHFYAVDSRLDSALGCGSIMSGLGCSDPFPTGHSSSTLHVEDEVNPNS